MEMLEVMKDSDIPLNYGTQELEEDMETAKRLGMLECWGSAIIRL